MKLLQTILMTALAASALASTGCYSILNGWLDPTVLGSFDRTATTEIRTSLTLEDTPPGIPGATYPSAEDLKPQVFEYALTAGDTLEVEINELRQRQIPYLSQVQVASTGYVNLPVVGRVTAAGITVPEFEEAVKDALRTRNILVDPEVTVNPLFLQKATYSIFGVGVSAANNAPLRAGTFPIRRPDLRVLEAINQVGGLNEFVSDVFIFRFDEDEAWPAPANGNRSDSAPAMPSGNGAAQPMNGALQPAPAEPDRQPPPGHDAAQDVLDVIEGQPPRPPHQDQAPPDEAAAIIESTVADPSQPYIFINDEFVPNPAYRGAEAFAPRSTTIEPPPFDTAAPAFQWSRLAGDSTFRIIHIPAESLRSGDPSWNIFVRAGDVIRISTGEIGVYFVMGQVNRVGAFAFNAEPITLKAAIATAGGLSGLAWPDRCTVYRRLGQREQMIQVNLDRIFAGLDPDFLIKRGDIINVGTHPFAPFLQRIRALTLPNIASNVGYSFTYARNYADIDSFAVRQNPHNRPDRFPNLFR